MSEHLSLERISGLLDEGPSEADARNRRDDAEGRTPSDAARARAHLDGCPACRAEYERLSRMRMALSAMGEAEPPAGEWEAIERRLDARAGTAGGTGLFLTRAFSGWPIRAAAALLLFVAGILAGFQITGLGYDDERPVVPWAAAGGGEPTENAEAAAAASELAALEDQEAAYLAALDALRELGAPHWTQGLVREAAAADQPVEPAVAAERLARLDALIRASRQAVEEAPADPVANDLLFQLVDERNTLASRFRESLHLTTLEYR